MLPKKEVSLDISEKNVMSVIVPVFHYDLGGAQQSDGYNFGLAFTSGEIDAAVSELSEILPDMIKLAELEKSSQLMAEEIEKTRRRVNALEYVKIPQMQENIRYITMKLDENERANTIRLMKVKDMILQEAIREQRAADAEALRECSM